MKELKSQIVLQTFGLSQEDVQEIINTFTEAQKAMFHQLYTDAVLERAALEYNPECPIAHVSRAAELSGAMQLLTQFLTSGEDTSDQSPV